MAMGLRAAGIRRRSAQRAAAEAGRVLIWHPSPNCGPRRDNARPDLIVIHYTAMGSAQAALERLCDPEAEVSAHYLIGRCGSVWQMVDEAERAWHAGAGQWGAVCDVNSRSVGIELDNRGDHPFAEPQMRALEALLPGIMSRWGIPPERVIGHSDMAPARKIDPGPRFDWRRLARQGVSVWPGDAGDDRLTLGAALRDFGYAVAADDTPAPEVVAAFCTRFGLRDAAQVLAAARDLAARFPVDQAPASA